eukprot:Rmarinus@m.14454
MFRDSAFGEDDSYFEIDETEVPSAGDGGDDEEDELDKYMASIDDTAKKQKDEALKREASTVKKNQVEVPGDRMGMDDEDPMELYMKLKRKENERFRNTFVSAGTSGPPENVEYDEFDNPIASSVKAVRFSLPCFSLGFPFPTVKNLVR